VSLPFPEEYFFLAMFYFWAVVLDLDKYVSPWQRFFLGGRLRFESSYIRASTGIIKLK
jgi:hypothetical protein